MNTYSDALAAALAYTDEVGLSDGTDRPAATLEALAAPTGPTIPLNWRRLPTARLEELLTAVENTADDAGLADDILDELHGRDSHLDRYPVDEHVGLDVPAGYSA